MSTFAYTHTVAVDLLLRANNHAVTIYFLVSCTYWFWVCLSTRVLPSSIRERELVQSKGSTCVEKLQDAVSNGAPRRFQASALLHTTRECSNELGAQRGG